MKYFLTIVIAFITTLNPCNGNAETLCGHLRKERSTGICTLFPHSTEGPYYVGGQTNRADITEGKPGIKLELHLTVVNFTNCEPLANVAVDLWQCDANGDYSSFQKEGNFLRGVQLTNAKGEVRFYTIFPGWYTGRTVHIHVDAWVNQSKHTGQMFFTEELTQEVAKAAPYMERKARRTTNAQDGIYNDENGNATTLIPTGSITAGFKASLLMGFLR